MITRDKMFVPMLGAYPGFAKFWQEFVDEWSDEPEGLPYYVLVSGLVRELSKMLSEGNKQHVRNVFDVVEKWHVEGDAYVKEVATVGFLEDLQNTNLHEGTAPGDFVDFLGPESLFWWGRVGLFWSEGKLIADG